MVLPAFSRPARLHRICLQQLGANSKDSCTTLLKFDVNSTLALLDSLFTKSNLTQRA